MARSWIHAFSTHKKRRAFKEDFFKEWESWIKNNVVRRLPPEELKNVDKQHVFTAPARMVRVNKGAMEGASSRQKEPNGHTDPGLGSFRSDAPTTLWSAVQLTKIIASTHRWPAYIFDVSTAFLSGKEVERLLYMKAPIDGFVQKPCLQVSFCECARAQIVCPKHRDCGTWGPRRLLEEIGFSELTMARASFFWSKMIK